jgi:hypothetical protein
MASSLRGALLGLFIAAFAANLSIQAKPAAAAEMDKTAKADAKTAMRFYKEGNYEDAAKIFVKLSVAYPDRLVFVRNLGACYYYMRRYEPALSNLRDYLHRKKDLAPDDRAEVSAWIGEMERVRDQTLAVAAAPPLAAAVAPAPTALPVAPAPAAPPVVPSIPMAAPSAPSGPAPSPLFAPATAATAPSPLFAPATAAAAPSPVMPVPAPPAQPGENAFSQPGPANGQPDYAQAQYAPQPSYAQGQYGAPPIYPDTQYSQNGGGYPPSYQQAPQPPLGSSAAGGVVAPAKQQPSSGGGRTVAAWILGIAGVGAAGVGVYFAVKAKDDFSKVETKYDPSLEKEGKNASIAAWVLCGAGAAAVVTGLIVGFSGGSSSSSVALAPVMGPGTAGATLGGSF